MFLGVGVNTEMMTPLAVTWVVFVGYFGLLNRRDPVVFFVCLQRKVYEKT